MSNKAVSEFLDLLSQDQALADALKARAIPNSDPPEVAPEQTVALAAEHGFDFSVDELQALLVQSGQGELSDADLEAVTGGTGGVYTVPTTRQPRVVGGTVLQCATGGISANCVVTNCTDRSKVGGAAYYCST